MFGRQSSTSARPTTVRRSLWADESTPRNDSAELLALPPVSFNRALSLIDAEELLRDLMARGDSLELTIVREAIDFVNAGINNNFDNFNIKVSNLLVLLKACEENNAAAFTYCKAYLATQMATCIRKDNRFRQEFNACPLRAYLEVNLKPQSPQKLAASPSKR